MAVHPKHYLPVLERTREIVEQGWCQFYFESKPNCRCLIGAFCEAAKQVNLQFPLFQITQFWKEANSVAENYVTQWNDQHGRTKQEVLVSLDNAILKIKEIVEYEETRKETSAEAVS